MIMTILHVGVDRLATACFCRFVRSVCCLAWRLEKGILFRSDGDTNDATGALPTVFAPACYIISTQRQRRAVKFRVYCQEKKKNMPTERCTDED